MILLVANSIEKNPNLLERGRATASSSLLWTLCFCKLYLLLLFYLYLNDTVLYYEETFIQRI